ncbi:MAG: adenylate/guanylate cyclase domain-containing protein [Candidatus Accumulibacter propinquus]|mgnify:FL=1|jgi:adenylate cyclase|uniref:adenylate/guanylate cyclase domain-containing protein n=1 Tax=Candidatus Accumulibacter TaxID=327159 RepID=UPI001ACFC2F1|nr:adenylate/guanylate cyclase domain-containing protein [Accumulibacter sp.]MBK8384898.1 FHA domain-containing protein [Accumulibacter sp.]MBN8438816.1 FHA domain-containing protein [Accumulibacter sp.]
MEQAVLFADVTGSTKLYETIGDSGAKRLVDACLDVLRAVTAAYGGRVIKTIGDELMAVFPGADAIVRAACEMQIRLSELDSAMQYGLSIRIGFHAGRLIEENGDVFGDAVNIAARMTGLAKAAQIITTEATAKMMSPELRDSTRSMGSFAVRGKAESIAVCEVIWQVENLTMITGSLPGDNPPTTMSLDLAYAGGLLTFRQGDEAVTIGRDASCRINLPVLCASRKHARIEFRRDKFVLTDTSTNGTYVRVDAARELVINREDFVLSGSGEISLGHSNGDGGPDLTWKVRF